MALSPWQTPGEDREWKAKGVFFISKYVYFHPKTQQLEFDTGERLYHLDQGQSATDIRLAMFWAYWLKHVEDQCQHNIITSGIKSVYTPFAMKLPGPLNMVMKLITLFTVSTCSTNGFICECIHETGSLGSCQYLWSAVARPLLSEQPAHSLVYLKGRVWKRGRKKEGISCYDGRGGGRKEGV